MVAPWATRAVTVGAYRSPRTSQRSIVACAPAKNTPKGTIHQTNATWSRTTPTASAKDAAAIATSATMLKSVVFASTDRTRLHASSSLAGSATAST